MMQAILAGVPLNTKEWKSLGSQPHFEALLLLRHASRISQGECHVHHSLELVENPESAVVDVGVARKLGSHVKFGMDL